AAAEGVVALRMAARGRLARGAARRRIPGGARLAGRAMTTARKPRDDAHLAETRIDGEAVYDGALLHVRRDRVRLPDGAQATREYVVHPGAVLVVPVLDDGRLIVERQFRYPLQRVFLEFPAGKIDPGEAPEQ